MLPLNVVFSTLSISYHSFMACKVSGKIQLIALWEFPYILLCFSLADSRILSSFVIFAILIMICLYVGVVGFILFWTLCVPFTWIFVFFFLFREILAVISSNLFLNPPPSFYDPMMQMLVHLKLFRDLLNYFHFKNLFLFFLLF